MLDYCDCLIFRDTLLEIDFGLEGGSVAVLEDEELEVLIAVDFVAFYEMVAVAHVH